MNRPEILIHEWTRPRWISASEMPRPRKPYWASVNGQILVDGQGSIRRFRNDTLACNAAREAARNLTQES